MKDISELFKKGKHKFTWRVPYTCQFKSLSPAYCVKVEIRDINREFRWNCPIVCAEVCAPLELALKLSVSIAKARRTAGPQRTAPANSRIGQYRGGS
jgi:hypothetical protein